MSGVNKVILIGHLGKDPELKDVNGNKVAKFSLATYEPYKDRDGNKIDRTEWHNIVLWRANAETAEKFLRKGSQIYLEGKLRTRSWDDKDGNKRYTTEIEGETFTILSKKAESNSDAGHYVNDNQDSTPSQAQDSGQAAEDDLPF